MKYAKELKLVRVEVGASLSGASELDMKVLVETLQCIVGWSFIFNLTLGTAEREKGECVELDRHYSPVQIWYEIYIYIIYTGVYTDVWG